MRYAARGFRSLYEHEQEAVRPASWSSACGTRVDRIEIGPQPQTRRRSTPDKNTSKPAFVLASSPGSQFPESIRSPVIKRNSYGGNYMYKQSNVTSARRRTFKPQSEAIT